MREFVRSRVQSAVVARRVRRTLVPIVRDCRRNLLTISHDCRRVPAKPCTVSAEFQKTLHEMTACLRYFWDVWNWAILA